MPSPEPAPPSPEPATPSPRAAPPVVRLYVRDGSHLCDEAIALVDSLVAEGVALSLEQVDIESRDELHRAYLERIPVAEVDGAVVFELVPDRAALAGALSSRGTL